MKGITNPLFSHSVQLHIEFYVNTMRSGSGSIISICESAIHDLRCNYSEVRREISSRNISVRSAIVFLNELHRRWRAVIGVEFML